MIFLLAFFGFFALLSVAALVKFSGNPVFLFTLLLCLASLVTLWRADADAGAPSRKPRGAPKTKRAKPARKRAR